MVRPRDTSTVSTCGPTTNIHELEDHPVNKVHSSDGTAIAFDQLGDGPPVVLVCGASTDRMANAPLAKLLAERLIVFNYDRRGRGDSNDTPPYAVEREVEDIGAVIDVAGGSAFVYGNSSGAAVALEPGRRQEAGAVGAAAHPRRESPTASRPCGALRRDDRGWSARRSRRSPEQRRSSKISRRG